MRRACLALTTLACFGCSGGTSAPPGGSSGGTTAEGTSGAGATGTGSAAGGSSGSAAGGSSTGGSSTGQEIGGSSTGGSSSGGVSSGGGASTGAETSTGAASTGGASGTATGGEGTSGGSSTGGTPTCTSCPSGFACGTANGIPVCRNTQTQIPLFSHVFVIMMENTSAWELSASATPYLTSVGAAWASSTAYSGVTDPSLPNYVAITSGGTQNITCDCNPNGTPACSNPGCSNLGTSDCDCGGMTVTHLGDELDQASLTWKNYGESMGTDCNPTGSGAYAPKHVPFLYYQDVLGNSNASYCPDHVVDFGNHFAADLAAGPPSFSMIAPNLNDDMHGTGLIQTSQDVANGDSWLSQEVPPILASPAFEDGIVFIVWDEGYLSTSPSGVPFYLLSPLAKSGGYSSSVAYNHYSLLATIEDGLGLARLGSAAGVAPLQDFFPAN